MLPLVQGKPLELPFVPNPTQKEIDDWHNRYIEALIELYDAHKDTYDKDRKSDIKIL